MERSYILRQGNLFVSMKIISMTKIIQMCLIVLQPSSKAGEIELNLDVNSNNFSFLKNNRIDDLFILPYAGYLVSLIDSQYNIKNAINFFVIPITTPIYMVG